MMIEQNKAEIRKAIKEVLFDYSAETISFADEISDRILQRLYELKKPDACLVQRIESILECESENSECPECDRFVPFKSVQPHSYNSIAVEIAKILPSKEMVSKEDSLRLDWIQSIMIPKDSYCEVFFAGLRNGHNDATEFQIESNPENFPVIHAVSVRECIDNAMEQFKTETNENKG